MLTKKVKSKNLERIFFGGDVTICMYPLPPMSLFVSNFGYPPPNPYPLDVIFEWPLRSFFVLQTGSLDESSDIVDEKFFQRK